MQATPVITGGGILYAQFLARKGAVSLEVKGMTRRGTPATQICRRIYGITKRSKLGVLNEMEAMQVRMKAAAIICWFAQDLCAID